MRNRSKWFIAAGLLTLMAFNAPNKLKVTSTSFTPNGIIPAKYSCDGIGISPPLSVANIPINTKSLAIIVHDPDAPHPGGVTHWVAWNLPLNGIIPENFQGGKQGENSDHKTGYKAICPPDGTHRYNFKVYALDEVLMADTTTDKAALEKVMKGHILAEGELMGFYGKGK